MYATTHRSLWVTPAYHNLLYCGYKYMHPYLVCAYMLKYHIQCHVQASIEPCIQEYYPCSMPASCGNTVARMQKPFVFTNYGLHWATPTFMKLILIQVNLCEATVIEIPICYCAFAYLHLHSYVPAVSHQYKSFITCLHYLTGVCPNHPPLIVSPRSAYAECYDKSILRNDKSCL